MNPAGTDLQCMAMAITMVKGILKVRPLTAKHTHIISRFIAALLLIGLGSLFYSSMQKDALYEFPFSEEEIKEVKFFNIMRNDAVWVDDEAEIEALFDLLRKMRINEQLLDTNEVRAEELPLGGSGFILTVFTKSGNTVVYQYDQLGRNAYSGYGIFSDSNSKYSVNNLDLTRLWLRFFEGK